MPVQRLVYHAMGQDVDLTIVDGAVVSGGPQAPPRWIEKKIIADARGHTPPCWSAWATRPSPKNPKLYELTQKM